MAEHEVGRFLTMWARLRARIDQGVDILSTDVDGLAAAARTAREAALAAVSAIEIGAMTGDVVVRARGLSALSGLDDHDIVRALGRLTDFTVIGGPAQRRNLLGRWWKAELGAQHPVCRFIDDPSVVNARVLSSIVGPWGTGAITHLDSEIGRQVAWRALQQWVQNRNTAYLDLLEDSRLYMDAVQGVHWEHQLIQALKDASKGFVADALDQMAGIVAGCDEDQWKKHQIQRAVTTYAFLAVPRVDEWMRVSGGVAFSPHDAADPLERFGSSVLCAQHEPRRTAELLSSLEEQIERHAWVAFTVFLQYPSVPQGVQAGQHLLQQATNDPAVWSALPWLGRENAFASACGVLSDRSLAFRLLVGAGDHLRLNALRTHLIKLIEEARSDDIAGVSRTLLLQLVSGNAETLSAGTREMAARGFICRAVVDGSNVVLAGRNGGSSKGSFALYEQAMLDLREHGFRDIFTYFDASTQYRMTSADWRAVKELESAGTVEITRGQADPHIIRKFLENPEMSWVVTSDDYREPMRQFPALEPYWFHHRLHFHHGPGGRLIWDRPFGDSLLPYGAPTRLHTKRMVGTR